MQLVGDVNCVVLKYIITCILARNIQLIYAGCPRRNVPDFGRVFLMLNYTDITQTPMFKFERLRR